MEPLSLVAERSVNSRFLKVSMVDEGKEVKSTGVLIRKSPTEIVTEGKLETGESVRFVFSKVKDAPKRKAKKE